MFQSKVLLQLGILILKYLLEICAKYKSIKLYNYNNIITENSNQPVQVCVGLLIIIKKSINQLINYINIPKCFQRTSNRHIVRVWPQKPITRIQFTGKSIRAVRTTCSRQRSQNGDPFETSIAVTDRRAHARSTLPSFRIQQESRAVTRLSNMK